MDEKITCGLCNCVIEKHDYCVMELGQIYHKICVHYRNDKKATLEISKDEAEIIAKFMDSEWARFLDNEDEKLLDRIYRFLGWINEEK